MRLVTLFENDEKSPYFCYHVTRQRDTSQFNENFVKRMCGRGLIQILQIEIIEKTVSVYGDIRNFLTSNFLTSMLICVYLYFFRVKKCMKVSRFFKYVIWVIVYFTIYNYIIRDKYLNLQFIISAFFWIIDSIARCN